MSDKVTINFGQWPVLLALVATILLVATIKKRSILLAGGGASLAVDAMASNHGIRQFATFYFFSVILRFCFESAVNPERMKSDYEAMTRSKVAFVRSVGEYHLSKYTPTSVRILSIASIVFLTGLLLSFVLEVLRQ